ncbi:VHS domain-containing protein [Tanacetum coccineum]
MDQSRRAVESYWRSKMIDVATSDEDKVTPVYKLEEICDLLRSSHVSIVKEIVEFILKRLQHKSPIVKQKINLNCCYKSANKDTYRFIMGGINVFS